MSGFPRLRFPGLLLLLCLHTVTLGACGSAAARPAETLDWRFGIVESYEAPQQASKAGAAWTRVRFHWKHIWGDSSDTWEAPISDEALAAELGAGREVVGLLIGTPDWVRDERLLPRGLWLAHDDPGNLWATFVRQAVSRYAGRIDHWIIWNEPDIWEKSAPGHTWDGDAADFAQLQRVAYRVATEANPSAVVHLAAFTYFWDANYQREQYFARLLSELESDPQAAEYDYYFDVATAHLYFQPNLIYEIIVEFKAIMAAHGLDKPLWLVETNAPPVDDPKWPVPEYTLSVTLDEQAAFVPQALASALAAGAERVAIYKLKDLESDAGANPEPFGLLRADGSARPAFDSYSIAVRYLAGAREIIRERWDEVGQIRLEQGVRPKTFTTTVLFARLPAAQTAVVPATGEEAILVDMWGKQKRIRPEASMYAVELPAARCSQSIGDYCMIGGDAYYLVQAAAGGTLPDRLPAPQPSPTSTPPPADAAAPPGRSQMIAYQPQTTFDVTSNEAAVSFPDRITFQLAVEPAGALQEATLVYDVVQQSCVDVAAEVPVAVEDGTASWTWVMSRSGNPPPGAVVWWEWELAGADGTRMTTPRQELVLADTRFDWQTVSDERIHLHWYEGDAIGPLLLDAAVAGLERLEEDMGVTLVADVSIYIYEDAAAMRDAVLYVQDWAGGLAFSEYSTVLIGVPPAQAEEWGRDTVRHELAHLVVGQFGWSCLGGSRPTWLEEGLAVYAEGPPDEAMRAELEAAIAGDRFVPLRTLGGSFPAHDAGASLAYSQSYSVVNFLLDEYGQEALQDLIAALASGMAHDEAFEHVYGVNVDGLEVAWREAIGAPPRTIPPTPTPLRAAAIPTVPPLAPPQQMPTPPTVASEPAAPEVPGSGLCAGATLPLLAGLVLSGGAWLTRRRR
ncbi:MAG: peptidase MA family metallohydrolase [Anaerolineae bacterium]|nr:peptidase MA family metallohydrolase [Anaerolineae bacterium]